MVSTIRFNRRILVLGCGSIAQCSIPLLLKHLELPPDNITVLDMEDRREGIAQALRAGVKFVTERITRANYPEQLSRHIGAGDILIDLAWNLGTVDLVAWCHEHDVLYLNTSTEVWDPYATRDSATEGTLYDRQMDLRRLISTWPNNQGPTALIEHGANAGIISHFVRVGLTDIAHELLAKLPSSERSLAIGMAVEEKAFNRLAQLLGVRVIHISERDTQMSRLQKEPGEFVNTWSVEGCIEEGTAPPEIGWGTHEQSLPAGARGHTMGPRNQIVLPGFGMNCLVHSCLPSGEIIGMVIRHGEAFSVSEALTVTGENGAPVYRPTVHYAYCPCDAAIASLEEFRHSNYKVQKRWRIMMDEIVEGRDEMGCLLMGHDLGVWWTGSLLDIHETRRLVPGQNATTLQVAAGVLSGLFWIIRNPRAGVCLPDDLPYDEVMEIARTYLGPFVSQRIDWLPPALRKMHSSQPGLGNSIDNTERWQFKNFMVAADRVS